MFIVFKKQEVIVIDEDEEMEDETVVSDDDDETWAPNTKERKKNRKKEKSRLAATKPPPTISITRKQALPIIDRKKNLPILKNKKRGKNSRKEKSSLGDSIRLSPDIKIPPPRKSLFEQTLENAARPTQKSKGCLNAAQMAARRALRRPFYAFPQGQQNLSIQAVDQTDLYFDDTDWDSESSLDDEHEPPLDSIYIKDPKIGPGRSRWIPCLEKVVAFIPKDKKPKDPLLLIEFRIQYGLFDRNLETALNNEKECARRWRVLEALKEKGFFDNLRIFDVPHPFEYR